MRRLFLRSFLIALVAFTVLFGAEFFLEWSRAGYPGVSGRSFAGINNNAKLVDVLSPMARAYNNVLAMLIGKALDRNDRDVAAEGAWALKLLLDHYYDKYKTRMPKEWFIVDRADFVGLSDEALEMISETKTWYEYKCLLQLELGFMRALS